MHVTYHDIEELKITTGRIMVHGILGSASNIAFRTPFSMENELDVLNFLLLEVRAISIFYDQDTDKEYISLYYNKNNTDILLDGVSSRRGGTYSKIFEVAFDKQQEQQYKWIFDLINQEAEKQGSSRFIEKTLSKTTYEEQAQRNNLFERIVKGLLGVETQN